MSVCHWVESLAAVVELTASLCVCAAWWLPHGGGHWEGGEYTRLASTYVHTKLTLIQNYHTTHMCGQCTQGFGDNPSQQVVVLRNTEEEEEHKEKEIEKDEDEKAEVKEEDSGKRWKEGREDSESTKLSKCKEERFVEKN